MRLPKINSKIQKEYFFYYVVFVPILLLFIVAISAFLWMSETKTTKEVVPILREIAADMNQDCPVILNKILRSDKVEAEGKNLILHYSLIKVDINKINRVDLLSDIGREMIPTICKIEVWRKVLLKGAVFKLHYYDKHENNIGNIIISNDKCLQYEQ